MQNLLDLAQQAARQGAEQIRSMQPPKDPQAWGRKGISDYVTRVDREAERVITETLLGGAPGSVVRGEELSPDPTAADLVWVVDPLDGTANYLHGYPVYGISIAAIVDGTLAVGVVMDVDRDLLYHATANGGTWCSGQRLSVSPVTNPEHALIGTGFPFKVPHLLPQYIRQFVTLLQATGGIRRAGAASLDLVDVARGRFEGFWELYLAPWDVAAGALMVREAGGVITDLAGNTDVARHGAIVAGNPAIHNWLLQTLRD